MKSVTIFSTDYLIILKELCPSILYISFYQSTKPSQTIAGVDITELPPEDYLLVQQVTTMFVVTLFKADMYV